MFKPIRLQPREKDQSNVLFITVNNRDDSEKLYNHATDPKGHTNLASNTTYSAIKKWHKKPIPETVALPADESQWRSDKYDKLIRGWSLNVSIPI